MRLMLRAAVLPLVFSSALVMSPLAQAELMPSGSDLSATSALSKAGEKTVTVTIDGSAAKSGRDSVSEEEGGVVDRLTAAATKSFKRFQQEGMASWYGRQFHGRKTASGETFNQNALTAAHRTLPMTCTIRVTNQDNGKSVIVRVNDRGPFHSGRILDLSYAAAKQIGIVNSGQGNVTIERIQ